MIGLFDFLYGNPFGQSPSDNYQDFQNRWQKNHSAQQFYEQELIRKRIEAELDKYFTKQEESIIINGEYEDITNQRALPKLDGEQ